MKKRWWFLILCAILGLTLAGCTSNADTLSSPGPSDSSSVSPNMTGGMGDSSDSPSTGPSPDNSPSPDTSATSGNGISTLEESKKASEEMEDAVVKLTEVDDAYVVAIGNMALVGVEFDGQYKGELDERMKKMILTRLQTISKEISEIYVSSEESEVASIQDLAEELEKAASLSNVTAQFDTAKQGIEAFKE